MPGKVTYLAFKRPYYLDGQTIVDKDGFFIYRSSWGSISETIPLIDILDNERDLFSKYPNAIIYHQNIELNRKVLDQAKQKIEELLGEKPIEEVLMIVKKELRVEDVEFEILEKIYLKEVSK